MISKIRTEMKKINADAVLLTTKCNRRYATDFPSSAGVVYISEKYAIFFTDFRYIEAAKQKIKGFEVRQVSVGEPYTTAVNEVLAHDRVSKIALENEVLTHSEYTNWQEKLTAEVVPMGQMMNRIRRVKTEAELENIIAAQRIAERAFEEILDEIRPGVTEKQIAAKLTYLMLLYGGENMSFDPIVVTGVNSSKPHGVPSSAVVAEGDFVTMDFGCIVNGYCSDMTRTVAVGYATDEMREVYETVLKAQKAGIETAKAGLRGCDVDKVARDIIAEAGYGEYFGHGFGHGVGVEIHEQPTVSMKGESVMEAGCVITAEPGIYIPSKFGVRIEDMLYLTEDGNRNLTKAPKELIIL